MAGISLPLRLLPPLPPPRLLVVTVLPPGTAFSRPQCVHVTDVPGVADVNGAPQFSQFTKANLQGTSVRLMRERVEIDGSRRGSPEWLTDA
jgi:hypothetical protein